MEENTFLKGWFKIDHYDKAGNLIETVETPNVITVDGMNEVAELIGIDTIASQTPTAFDYIAVGTGTTAAVKTDTALETEVTTNGLTRAASTGTIVTETDSGDTFQLVHSFSPTSSYAVTESGILNASTTGELLCHQTFSAINVSNGDTLTITWKITVA